MCAKLLSLQSRTGSATCVFPTHPHHKFYQRILIAELERKAESAGAATAPVAYQAEDRAWAVRGVTSAAAISARVEKEKRTTHYLLEV